MSRKEGYSKPREEGNGNRGGTEHFTASEMLQGGIIQSTSMYSVNSAQKMLKEVNLLKTIQISGDEGGLQT